MATQATRARWSKAANSAVSGTLAADGKAATGKPSVDTTRWYLVPDLPRSVGFGPVKSPPRLARTLQLSTTTSQARAAASGPDRAIRTRTPGEPAPAPPVPTTAPAGAAVLSRTRVPARPSDHPIAAH